MAFNKAVRVIAQAKRLVGSPSIYKWLNKTHAAAGVITVTTTTQIAFDAQGAKDITGGVVGSGPSPLTWIQATAFAKTIDQLNVGANHLLVKNNATWRQIYKLGTRNVAYMLANGTTTAKAESTMPCHNCGVILPLEFLQIDHHMPQAGGSDLHILKTLRALGMTTQAASGSKGQALAGGNLSALVVNPKARDRSYDHLLTASNQNKWTTNARGDAFLTLFESVNGRTDLARMCMNTILNLVPLCPECNRVKSDWVKPTA